MLPDRVSNPGPLTYESGALPIALHDPASNVVRTWSVSLPFLSIQTNNQIFQRNTLEFCIFV